MKCSLILRGALFLFFGVECWDAFVCRRGFGATVLGGICQRLEEMCFSSDFTLWHPQAFLGRVRPTQYQGLEHLTWNTRVVNRFLFHGICGVQFLCLHWQVSFGTIHGSFQQFKDVRAQVQASRGLVGHDHCDVTFEMKSFVVCRFSFNHCTLHFVLSSS